MSTVLEKALKRINIVSMASKFLALTMMITAIESRGSNMVKLNIMINLSL